MATKRIRVQLDWLIEVRGVDEDQDGEVSEEGEDQAVNVVCDYLKDQDFNDIFDRGPWSGAFELSTPEVGDDDVTVTLYPDDEDVPADEHGSWSTYHRWEVSR